MRSICTAVLLALTATGALAGDPSPGGPVSAGGFGMGGADYYGDVRSHMPFTREAPPHPIGLAEMARVRSARRRAEVAARHAPHRRLPHG